MKFHIKYLNTLNAHNQISIQYLDYMELIGKWEYKVLAEYIQNSIYSVE